jgi:hypothetical protein
MFWKTKKVKTTIYGIEVSVDSENFADLLVTMSAISNQTRKDFNALQKAHNLILDHLKLKYVPETETKEPAKLEEKTTVGSLTGEFFGCPMYVSDTPPTKPKKKRGRPKKK